MRSLAIKRQGSDSDDQEDQEKDERDQHGLLVSWEDAETLTKPGKLSFGRMFQMGDSGRHHGAQDTM
jgi:hypothetical protein